jgi:hypothetical protein
MIVTDFLQDAHVFILLIYFSNNESILLIILFHCFKEEVFSSSFDYEELL